MDPLTHGLASFALQRGFFPRAKWPTILAIIAAGVVADLDWFSATSGPAAYLRWHRTATHSIAFVFVLALSAIVATVFFRRSTNADSSPGLTCIALTAAASLHILMDLLQADPVAPLWPFSSRRFSLDLSPAVDLWLLLILAAAILLPELLRLVSDEIGSRNKRPRGRTGAIIGLTFVFFYFGLRGLFHGNAVIALNARTVAGEMPHRVGAFPDTASPFVWHCIVETDSALHLANMRSMGGDVSYAGPVTTLRKPEPSPMLSAAQISPAAVAFLKIARFPKATVQKETEGYSVEIHDLKDQATESKRAIFADITLDNAGHVVSGELQWQKPLTHP